MATERCFYEVLGVEKTADDQSLKRAYRKLAMEYHPDRNPDEAAVERFREIQRAYEVLSNPESRSRYDQFGHAGVSGRFAAGGAAGFAGMDDIFEGFQSIFDDFFGGATGRAGAQSRRGRDLRYRLELEFEEAAKGCEKPITIKRKGRCGSCEGTGAEPGTSPQTCPTCEGRGKIYARQGFFSISQACPHCRGRGTIIPKPCKACDGEGLSEETANIDVNVPAGVDTGIRLRVSGEGEGSAVGGSPGDLYVEIEVKSHEQFERDGPDIYTRVYVPFTKVTLGGEIEIPLIDGQHKIKVPKKMQAPHVEVIKGEGIQDLRSNRRGDLYVELHIETPKKLSSKAKKLLEELREEIESAEDESSEAKKNPSNKKKTGFFSSLF